MIGDLGSGHSVWRRCVCATTVDDVRWRARWDSDPDDEMMRMDVTRCRLWSGYIIMNLFPLQDIYDV